MNSNGGYFFGLGVPVQASTDLTNANFAGTYPVLGYLNYQIGASKYQSALPMEIQIDSAGNTKTESPRVSRRPVGLSHSVVAV